MSRLSTNRIILIIVFLLPLSGCDILNEDKECHGDLCEAAYSAPKYPAGFYQEELNGASLYYVNTVSIGLGSEWIELDTDSLEQARAWTELSCQRSSYYREPVSENETEKYFEFLRVNPQNPLDDVLFRVHKSSYITRSMYDRGNPGSIIGMLTQRPIDTLVVREAIEYLWFVDNYNMGGSKALSSHVEDADTTIIHTLMEILVIGGDYNLRDQLILYRSTSSVKQTSGEILYSREEIKTAEGKYPY